jgi:hypothetical protein
VVMDSKKNDLPTEYKTLQEVVDQSSLHTNRQLKTINGNSYIGGFILLVLALTISYFLNIFEYWIPAGFLLFYFLFITAFSAVRAPFIQKGIKDVLKHYKEKHIDITDRIDSCVQKNLAIIMQSVAVLYLVSFFILLSIEYNWIAIEQSFDLFVPAITCLLFLPVPFFIKEFYRFLSPFELKTSLQKILNENKNSLWKVIFEVEFLKPFFYGFYLALVLILPLVSLGFIFGMIAQWPYLILIFVLQCFMILLFANSFSANTVRKELTTTITTYADINYLLSMAQLQKHYTTTEYERLQTLYQSAKPYDFIVKDTFKFINYYLLTPNRFYLKEILKHPLEYTAETYSKPLEQPYKKPTVSPSIQKDIPHPTPAAVKPSTAQPTSASSSSEPVEKSESKRISLKSDKDIDDIKIGNVGILAYGPMLDHISQEIRSAMKKRISRVNTPFKVELARKNDSYGGAPALVPVSSGGSQVNAEILVLKDNVTERQALDMLYRMENHLEGTKKTYKKPSNPTPSVFVIKTLQNFYGIDKVFYPSIGRNINQITPKKLAKLTIDSVFNTEEKEPDGFNYLMSLKKYDISTPMVQACEEEILHQTLSSNLLESRQKLEEVKMIKLSI